MKTPNFLIPQLDILGISGLKKAIITKSAVLPSPYLLNRGDKVTVKVIFKGDEGPNVAITWTLESGEMIPAKINRLVSIVEGEGQLFFLFSNYPTPKYQNLKRAAISHLEVNPPAYLFNRGEKVTVTFIPSKEHGSPEEKVTWTLDKNEVTPLKIIKFIAINEGEGELYFLW
jgi:hypothetical protein